MEGKLGSKTHSIKIHPFVYKAAAILVLAVGLGFFAANYFLPTSLIVIRTGENELQRVNLSDGSTVILNENSVFKFPREFEDSGYRKVYLFGQGFFEIAKDDNQPFKIVGSSTTTEVLGTSFDLKSYKKNSQINVVTGKVIFRDKNNNERVVLKEGYSAKSTSKGTVVRHEIDEQMMTWRYGELDFKSQPLKEVAKVLSKHYKVKIKLKEGIENCLITSRFENKSLDEILEVLNVIANIESEKDEKGVVNLSGPSC
ncbi:FecR family protein [Reichenbachiella ulvae]|uniref:FecR domain-containing protein n=1 Tax=Reichenbachiella ulvae TaxID=2980104 RepID=A0ABT3CR75_9BACT|nr:FecR domain-containing protein [Reichenbachiella ulvae]MCV9386157.1 FecR domain-containing protein [Reichenbachiella ulvae]